MLKILEFFILKQSTGFLNNLGSSPFFWIILIVIIAFIIYSGIKKNKKEKKQRKKRETEVKKIIKQHLKKKENLKNVAIKFLDVLPRSGKEYKTRDVYDVFIEIKDIKNNTVISKKAYEIEGVAKALSKAKIEKEKLDEEFIVNWSINKEFNYRKHYNLLKKEEKSLLSIYFQSLKKKNPKLYIKREKKLKKKHAETKKNIHKTLKKIEESYEVFRPKIKDKEDA